MKSPPSTLELVVLSNPSMNSLDWVVWTGARRTVPAKMGTTNPSEKSNS